MKKSLEQLDAALEAGETARHTPGPWSVNKINGGYHIGGRAYGVPNVIEVATVTNLKERSEANAKLIASAPELLEACKSLLELCKGGVGNALQRMDRAAEVIAKAEGSER